jgi:DNA polymerase-3 subunit delta
VTAPVYYLAGEAFLAEEALQKVRDEVSTDPLSEVEFYPAADVAAVIEALETPSLLGGRRVVIVRDAHALKKDATEALTSYLASPSEHSVLVLVGDARSKLMTQAKKVGSVVTLDAPRGRRLATWLRERAREHRLKLDDRGAWALIDAVGSQLRDLDVALSQLSTGLGTGAKVGAAEVRRAFPRLADERIYAFTDAVGARKPAASVGMLRRLLEQGDEPLMLFGALVAQVRRMLVARRVVEQGPRAVGDLLGMPEWRAERLHRQARSYREGELMDAMEVLAECDVEMKGGDLPPEVALERAVLRIVQS